MFSVPFESAVRGNELSLLPLMYSLESAARGICTLKFYILLLLRVFCKKIPPYRVTYMAVSLKSLVTTKKRMCSAHPPINICSSFLFLKKRATRQRLLSIFTVLPVVRERAMQQKCIFCLNTFFSQATFWLSIQMLLHIRLLA